MGKPEAGKKNQFWYSHMWKGKVWAGSNKPEVQTAEHGAAFCSLSHLSWCCATWHSNLGTTSARFFFFFFSFVFTMQCYYYPQESFKSLEC